MSTQPTKRPRTQSKKKSAAVCVADPLLKDEVLFHSFGVGHGDCSLIEFKVQGVVEFRLLCDAGEALPDALLKHLTDTPHRNGGGHIDVAILTHVDNDHQGGFPALFSEKGLSVGEYWGPCLPAFGRLRWLFPRRVQTAVERGSEIEKLAEARGTPVIYPFEGHNATFCDRRVTVSVISPAPRLIRQLAEGSASSVRSLLTAPLFPLQWLITGASLDAGEDHNELISTRFDGRVHLAPEDFDDDYRENPIRAQNHVNAEARERMGDAFEPDFFGNGVLNNTSLVVMVELLLDGHRRRRILLTGDQENWSYIASKYPVGLGIDLLKVPHHGGNVYLADTADSHAIEQTYLWLRPQIACVSAEGRYRLPHVRVREALRQAGSTLMCPNTRTFEPIAPNAQYIEGPSCYTAYSCNAGGRKQSQSLTVRMSANSESADAAACLQGTARAGVSPIVVHTQRIVEPDEAFVRWTRAEIDKQAKWIKRCLDERHQEFLENLKKSSTPRRACLENRGITWSAIEAQAIAAGHHHLLADPHPVRKRITALGWMLTSEPKHKEWYQGHDTRFYRAPSTKELAAALDWVANVPNIFLVVHQDAKKFMSTGDRRALLLEGDYEGLLILLALRLKMPLAMIKSWILPQVIERLLTSHELRICLNHRRYSRGELVHLVKGSVAVPDLGSDTWIEMLEEKLGWDEELLTFLDSQDDSIVLASAVCSEYLGSGRYMESTGIKCIFPGTIRSQGEDKVICSDEAFLRELERLQWAKL